MWCNTEPENPKDVQKVYFGRCSTQHFNMNSEMLSTKYKINLCERLAMSKHFFVRFPEIFTILTAVRIQYCVHKYTNKM